jgi:cephalosporin hydroxylase
MTLLRRLHRGLRRIAAPVSIPDSIADAKGSEFEVNKWIISHFIVERLIAIVGAHPYPLDELLLMAAAVCRMRPTHIFEWGTHVGKSARIFFEVSRQFGIETEIHSIDLPDGSKHEEHPGRKRGMFVKEISTIKLHEGDGLDKSMEILSKLPANIKPLFFLDGDHTYDSVVRELVGIMTKAPDAAILVHDTFYQSAESGYNTGPYKAIAYALQTVPNHYKRIDAAAGLPGMTLLHVR